VAQLQARLNGQDWEETSEPETLHEAKTEHMHVPHS
jgi:hypothetical protein